MSFPGSMETKIYFRGKGIAGVRSVRFFMIHTYTYWRVPQLPLAQNEDKICTTQIGASGLFKKAEVGTIGHTSNRVQIPGPFGTF
jgi:hypothetical protein